jgi:hypothetical protein
LGADVRCGVDVFEGEEFVVFRGFFFENVEGGGFDFALG